MDSYPPSRRVCVCVWVREKSGPGGIGTQSDLGLERCGGRQGQDAGHTHHGPQRPCDAEVGRTKVVGPFGDAVGLIPTSRLRSPPRQEIEEDARGARQSCKQWLGTHLIYAGKGNRWCLRVLEQGEKPAAAGKG